LYRGISDFNKVWQPRTNIVYWVVDSLNILAKCKNYFFQLLNAHGVNDVRHTEIHTAEPLVPEPSDFDFELAIEKLKSHKSPVND